MKAEEIERNYATHRFGNDQAREIGCVKHQARDLALMINDRCPDSREKSLALTKLEEATMWACAAIARNGE